MKLKTVFDETGFQKIWNRFCGVITDKSGGMRFGKNMLPENQTVKVIGGITYMVSSCFDEKAKGNVIDKISRLIDKEIKLSHSKPNIGA